MLVFASFPVVHPDSGRHIGKTARDIWKKNYTIL
jgi:hypothetical protein